MDWNNQTGKVRGVQKSDRIINNYFEALYFEALRNKAYQYVTIWNVTTSK